MGKPWENGGLMVIIIVWEIRLAAQSDDLTHFL